MKKLENLTNVETPSSDYPYGNMKNNSGTNNGTPVNRDLLTDVIQFTQKLADEAGITLNDLPDNATNGWQLYEAFRKLTRSYRMYQALTIQSSTGAPTATVLFNDLGFTPTWSRQTNGYYKLNSTNGFTDGKTVVRPISVPGSNAYQYNFYKPSGQDDEIILFTLNDSDTLADDLIGHPVLVEVLIFD